MIKTFNILVYILADHNDKNNFSIALAIGLLIGLLQGPPIQEMTLSFVPKLFVVLGAMALFATYTLSTMTDYFMFIFDEIALKDCKCRIFFISRYEPTKHSSVSLAAIMTTLRIVISLVSLFLSRMIPLLVRVVFSLSLGSGS